MIATGGQIAFMRASTKIIVLMRALTKIRGEQRLPRSMYALRIFTPAIWGSKRGHFLSAPPMLYYRKAGALPVLPVLPERPFFFLDAKLLNAQELRMTLVCSEESKLPQINTNTNTNTNTSTNIHTITMQARCHRSRWRPNCPANTMNCSPKASQKKWFLLATRFLLTWPTKFMTTSLSQSSIILISHK